MDAADIGGSVFVQNKTAVTGRIDLRAKVARQVSFNSATVTATADALAIDMNAADVGGSVLVFNKTAVTGRIDLRSKVAGQVSFNDATVTATADALAINMESADVGSSVLFQNKTAVTGRINLRAKVARQVSFNDATVTATIDATAIDMDAADVGGSVLVSNKTAVTGRIDLRAKVARQVSFNDATVTATADATAIDMESADVGGSVHVSNKTAVTGRLDLRAKVGGLLAFNDAIVTATADATAIDMDSADIGGPVIIMDFHVVGRIDMTAAILRAGLFATKNYLADRFIKPEPGGRLAVRVIGDWQLSFAEVTGPVLLHEVSIWGKLSARHLTTHGDFDLCGSVIGPDRPADALLGKDSPFKKNQFDAADVDDKRIEANRGKDWTVNLELAEIHGRLWIRSSRVIGRMNLEDSEIAGEANFCQTKVYGDLVLRSAIVKGRAFVETACGHPPYPRVTGVIDLAYAGVQQIEINLGDPDKNTPGDVPRYFNLTGAHFGTLDVKGRVGAPDTRPYIVTEGLAFESLNATGLKGGRLPGITINDWLRMTVFATLKRVTQHG